MRLRELAPLLASASALAPALVACFTTFGLRPRSIVVVTLGVLSFVHPLGHCRALLCQLEGSYQSLGLPSFGPRSCVWGDCRLRVHQRVGCAASMRSTRVGSSGDARMHTTREDMRSTRVGSSSLMRNYPVAQF